MTFASPLKTPGKLIWQIPFLVLTNEIKIVRSELNLLLYITLVSSICTLNPYQFDGASRLYSDVPKCLCGGPLMTDSKFHMLRHFHCRGVFGFEGLWGDVPQSLV